MIIKAEGDLRAWARRAGRLCPGGVVVAIVAVSLWTPFADPAIAQRWFSLPNLIFFAPAPILTAVIAWLAWRVGWLGRRRLCVWQAASLPGTQAFLLIGMLLLLPIILMYTGWSYWVFRGKVRGDVDYL